MRDDAKNPPKATEHELHQEPPPPRADAFDRMQRGYSDTIDPEHDAERPINDATPTPDEGERSKP